MPNPYYRRNKKSMADHHTFLALLLLIFTFIIFPTLRRLLRLSH
ncbi:hypothetical protein HMPREF1864_01303 [Peptoniphilus sp. DNF00840]|nr:hypothetical protein HMPREF1864_01303 [Peptoniphilus sp. DNF00840]